MDNKEVDITYVGHSTYIVETKDGTRLLIDPWLKNNPACPENLQEPKDIDYILITHGHFDHIGDLFPACELNKEAKIITSIEISTWLNAKGISNTLPMGIGGTQPIDNDIKVSGLCRGGMFTGRSSLERAAALDDNRQAVDEAVTINAQCLVLVVGGISAESKDINDARQQVRDGIGKL